MSFALCGQLNETYEGGGVGGGEGGYRALVPSN